MRSGGKSIEMWSLPRCLATPFAFRWPGPASPSGGESSNWLASGARQRGSASPP